MKNKLTSDTPKSVSGEVNGIPVIQTQFELYKPERFGNYKEVNGEISTLEWIIESGVNWLIEGDKGLGKTMAVYEVCAKNDIPLVEMRCSSGTTEGDIIGREHLNANGSVFELGIIPTFVNVVNHYKKGVLYLDEFNAQEAEIQKMYNSILDDRRHVIANGKRYKIDDDASACIIATQNPTRYAGTIPMNEDSRSRFAGEEWNYPTSEQIKSIIDWKDIPEVIQTRMIQLVMDNLGARRENQVDYVLSTRDIAHFTKLYRLFDKRIKGGNNEERSNTVLTKTLQTSVLIKFGEAMDREFIRKRCEETFDVELGS